LTHRTVGVAIPGGNGVDLLTAVDTIEQRTVVLVIAAAFGSNRHTG